MNTMKMLTSKISRRQALYTAAAGAAALGAALGAKELLAAPSSSNADQNNNSTNKTMNVLLINGSPHRTGCTYTALKEIADVLEHEQIGTDILWLGSDAICGCKGCGICRDTERCVIDDMVNKTIERIAEFDGFVFGSPVHYAAASGFITPFLDRLFYASGKLMQGKPGAAIVSCRRAGSTAALEQINKYFTISHMPIVSSQYWNMVHGNTPEQVRQDLEGMQIMRTLGRNMAWLLKCINAAKMAGIQFPEHEKRIGTNFIR